mgnify:CR=1 FL=1
MAALLKRYFTICFVLLAIIAHAQPGKRVTPLAAKDTSKPKIITQENFLYILAADKQYLQKSDTNQLVSYAGHVKVRQGKTLFYADSAIINPVLNTLESFGNVHINAEGYIGELIENTESTKL